jgi:hypothetical protein
MTEQEQFQAELAERIKARQAKNGKVQPFEPSLPLITYINPALAGLDLAPNKLEGVNDDLSATDCENCKGDAECADCAKAAELGKIVADLGALSTHKGDLSNSLHTFAPEDNAGRAACVEKIELVQRQISELLAKREAIQTVAPAPPKAPEVPNVATADTTVTEVRSLLNLRSQQSKLRKKLQENPADEQLAAKLADVEQKIKELNQQIKELS